MLRSTLCWDNQFAGILGWAFVVDVLNCWYQHGSKDIDFNRKPVVVELQFIMNKASAYVQQLRLQIIKDFVFVAITTHL